MKSLYRRYRPLRLADVVGQEQVTGPLMKSLEQGKVNHAYLFIGPRGCGKTSVARILAHEINGFKYEIEDEYVDIIEIDGASNRGIDDIRELRDKAAIAPTMGKYKVYIIDEVHMLTKEAFNALLKTLEEPPAHVVFIMATTDAYKVPVTITSRSQTFTFKLSTPDVMKKFLESVAKKEKIKIDSGALDVIVRRGGGSFRDSLSLLDQISTLSDSAITKELVVSALGLAEDEKVAELISYYVAHDTAKITELFKDLFATGVKPETISEEMIRQIIEEPKPELLPLLAKLPDVKAPYAEAKLLVAILDGGDTPPFSGAKHRVQSAPHTVMRAEQTIDNVGLNQPFDWEGFLERVKAISGGVHMKLKKANHSFDGKALRIYLKHTNAYNYVSSAKSKDVLRQAVGTDVKITIENSEGSPNGAQNDGLLQNISGIMGGEVTNDGGGSPF